MSQLQLIVTHPRSVDPLQVNALNASSKFLFGNHSTTIVTFENTVGLSNQYVKTLFKDTPAILAMYGDEKVLISELAVNATRRNLDKTVSVYFNSTEVVLLSADLLEVVKGVDSEHDVLALDYFASLVNAHTK